MKKSNLKVLLTYAVMIVIIFGVIALILGKDEAEPVMYGDVIDYFEKDAVIDFSVDKDDYLTMKVYVLDSDGNLNYDEDNEITNDTKTIGYQLRDLDSFREECSKYYTGPDKNQNLSTDFDFEPQTTLPWWVAFLPYVIVIVLMIVVWIVFSKQVSGGGGPGGKLNSFGKAKVKMPTDDKNKVLFKDVAGADEEKEELQEVVEFLRDPSRYAKLGAKIPHGVLLVGPPGTGKTLLAKAVAGEAGVPFFSISGSDFVEMYVGVGASRVRDLFENARKSPASIIFIDEIDAVGRHRGAGLGGGHDEREQTLNQLLVEMDGFGSHEGIIVIAATNRPDILDPALLRPGRFDRQITVNYPDIKGREEILKVHAKNKPLEDGVDLARVAKTTAGFTGADLANLLNEAALLASRRGKSLIGMDDIEDAFIKVIAGPKKKSRTMKEREKRNTAYHEAGHAILAHILPTMDAVQQISIIPSGNALGYTLNPPAEDKFSVYKEELKEKIVMLLGGRAAEEIIFGDISGGASNDIERATDIAKKMVTQLGMSELLGPRRFGSGHSEVFLGRDFSSSQDYSEEVAAKIDSEIHDIISEAYNKAKTLLRENMDKLHFIAEFLLKNEIMDGEQFKAAMEGTPTFEELEEMTEAKRRRSREENDERRRQLERERLAKEAAEANAENATEDNTEEEDTSEDNSDESEDIGPEGKRDDDNN